MPMVDGASRDGLCSRCRSRKSHLEDSCEEGRIRALSDAMLAILYLLGTFVANLFKSRRRLEVENFFLRHQLNVALRRTPHRLRLHNSDRALLVWLAWLWPSCSVCP
jgi:hypothetical protein